jgi:hypothetical protein
MFIIPLENTEDISFLKFSLISNPLLSVRWENRVRTKMGTLVDQKENKRIVYTCVYETSFKYQSIFTSLHAIYNQASPDVTYSFQLF